MARFTIRGGDPVGDLAVHVIDDSDAQRNAFGLLSALLGR